MAARIRDLLTANLVLVGVELLNGDDRVKSFKDSLDSEIVLEQLSPLNSAAEGRKITLPKDRISIDIFRERSVLRQEYPSEMALNNLASVAGLAIKNTTNVDEVRTHGYNIELVYDQDSGSLASTYIADRIFSDFSRNEGWRILGGQASFKFAGTEGKTWNVVIEPRFRNDTTDKVFLSINLHKEEKRLPEVQEIEKCLDETLHEAKTFIKRLDSSI